MVKFTLKNFILANFLSFANNASETIQPIGDDDAFDVSLGFNLFYFTAFYSTVSVNINGYLAFGTIGKQSSYWPITAPSPSNVISGYNVDLLTDRCGSLTTRSVSDQTVLNTIGSEINTLATPSPAFQPTNAFVATWNQVCAYDDIINGTVSFQIVISTDGDRAFLTLNYDLIEFSSYGVFYQYIDYNNTLVSTTLPSSPEASSNVNVNGKWIYFLSNGN